MFSKENGCWKANNSNTDAEKKRPRRKDGGASKREIQTRESMGKMAIEREEERPRERRPATIDDRCDVYLYVTFVFFRYFYDTSSML